MYEPAVVIVVLVFAAPALTGAWFFQSSFTGRWLKSSVVVLVQAAATLAAAVAINCLKAVSCLRDLIVFTVGVPSVNSSCGVCAQPTSGRKAIAKSHTGKVILIKNAKNERSNCES
ncbi:hypothetical protein ACFP2F_20880 [Hymenobacter artigasi]|uniref:Uncharacterized protein n=1 Tax=Hymenobacter artigasi TaxID=2719616 RepID=A0ABX1HN80_9BACT|nr:hypothetical protein [Hymenobacter artigasi]NKI91713.1 hypothetical protein [Hymenobacter artigasi]